MKNKGSNSLRDYKYIWLPAALLVYTAIMAWTFRDAVTVRHDYASYFSTLGVELLVIVALFFFLKKKKKLREEREKDTKNSERK